jgi:hypothetical protein
MNTILKFVKFMTSTVKCRICGGWGGEWGSAQGVGNMCYDCYKKKFGK